MSRAAQDTLAILRGLQLVAKSVIQSQDDCARHLWANSSIRDIVEQNVRTTRQYASKFAQNPQKELQDVLNSLKETADRGSVVVEGVRQYAVAAATQGSPTTASAIAETVAKITSNNTNLDISSITLKELENILSQRNRDVTLTNAQWEETPSQPEQSPHASDPKAIIPDASIVKDEQYVEGWMKFIASHEPKENIASIQPEIPVVPKHVPTTNLGRPEIILPKLSELAKQRSVPSSRIGRLATFGTLFAGLGVGTLNEMAKGAMGLGGAQNIKEALFSPGNTERIVDTLCKVRGAALKIGQILSIQDSSVVSPEMVKAFDRVRQAADYMPDRQVWKCMSSQFGDDWREAYFKTFDDRPFAAASIGQVHRAELRSNGMPVAVKIQYPGVARSIGSDIDNLVGMLKVWDVFPAGFFIDNIVKVAKRELVWEVDYIREAEYTEKFGEMIAPYPEYRVPKVIRDLTTKSVITTELVPGIPVDKCFDLSYEERRFIAESILRLCLRELFELRCMQTDPNWSNFMYDATGRQLVLIDFGSTRFYTAEFIDNYRNVIRAAISNDTAKVLDISRTMGFLTGYETRQMEEAHVAAVMTLGELFKYPGEFDFGKQETTKRVASLVPTMVAHRLCPPPEEIYSIHRKLSGVFLLCARLNVKMDCRPLYHEIVDK